MEEAIVVSGLQERTEAEDAGAQGFRHIQPHVARAVINW